MKHIAFASIKGGTGKTTLVFNLAWMCKEKGKKVLAVDFDPQGNLSSALTSTEGLPEESNTGRLFSRRSAKPYSVTEGLDLIWADLQLSGMDSRSGTTELLNPRGNLKKIASNYDVALLDTPSGLRPLTKAALLAADYVIAPVDPSPFAVAGVVQLVQSLVALKERFEYEPSLLGVVLNSAEMRTNITQQVLATVRELLGENRFLGVLNKSVRVKETVLLRSPLHRVAAHSLLAEQIDVIADRIIKETGL